MRAKGSPLPSKGQAQQSEEPWSKVKGKRRKGGPARVVREHWLQSSLCCPQTAMVWESERPDQVITVGSAPHLQCQRLKAGWGGEDRGRRPSAPQYKAPCCFHLQLLCPQSLTDPTYRNMRTKKILAQHIISFSFRMWKEFQLLQ